MEVRPPKRAKLDHPDTTPSGEVPVGQINAAASERATDDGLFLGSIFRPISPPRLSRYGASTPQADSATRVLSQATVSRDGSGPKPGDGDCPGVKQPKARQQDVKYLPSPFKLTSIRDLPPSHNIDTISLHDILGNPDIKEAWVFNFRFDVDWMMTHFDPEIRSQVEVKIVHGSWRTGREEHDNRRAFEDACDRWPNVEQVIGLVPDYLGTHHSKMFILLTHDARCQIFIHTANMVPKDWTNMTQAVWRSPLLRKGYSIDSPMGTVGSGLRFKHDLIKYLVAYTRKIRPLLEHLALFDFSPIRGALVASTPRTLYTLPKRHSPPRSLTMGIEKRTHTFGEPLYGYPCLFDALKAARSQKPDIDTATQSQPHVVCQVSSIATLPTTWLDRFFPTVAGQENPSAQMWDHISIVYPTSSNVAASLDGYASGGSIHTKAQSVAHLKQIRALRKSLCQWTQGSARAGRDQAAPHIKTYVGFSEKPSSKIPTPDIDWALLTSANLSTQAWGNFRETGKDLNEISLKNWELGVFVWPELFDEDFDTGDDEKQPKTQGTGESVKMRMVPVFGSDMPEARPSAKGDEGKETIVGLRLPYDLPLTPYGVGDMPWSPQGTYDIPDRHGRRWPRDLVSSGAGRNSTLSKWMKPRSQQ
ncbi:hypothetical protein H2202_007808 [Exophiala xenobiotica]|nr:hypothetical protein H2202_007808 [Exophiala xenobiotica]KAK5192335.1 hypothetical protein LTR92_007510 [Exophiala xenobiotica]KAK5207651.1 hypothetical protein LTR41_006695 [Exophiala xenobiotica]KAK5220676.1 hypothetical protein LTR72_007298 [Exophiala xenobiotica]KAK5232380.1 hypothetical protein LTR47_006593 [Exophiala xenobiotica]